MDLRRHLADDLDARREQLVALSHAVHADAEIAFEEHRSSQRVAAALETGGFDVEVGVCDLPTAFVARAGSGPLQLGICAEYDALPGIGHACGHNIIAAAAVGAGLALAEVADDLGLTVTVLGTPAEEGGGGKILMLDGGAFDGLHAALMVHPAPIESATFPCLAVQHIDVVYEGRSAHASAYPQQGINAADALTVAQVSLGLLRQHIYPTDRIHGIVRDGGHAPNIIPERTVGDWSVRSATLAELERELLPRVRRCFEAGAMATGAKLTFDTSKPAYSEFRHDDDLVALYEREAQDIGRVLDPIDHGGQLAGSTDMANVSLAMPAIHPMLKLETDAVNHQPGFTAACITPDADRAVRDGALGMARTAVAIMEDDDVRERLLARAFRAPSAG